MKPATQLASRHKLQAKAVLLALSSALLLGGAKAVNNASAVIAGYNISQLDEVFDTELRTDFGFPLSEASSEEQWIEAKKLKWSIINQAENTTFFPFLVCNHEDMIGSAGHYNEVVDLLSTASEAVNYPVFYTSPVNTDPVPDGKRKVVVRPLRTTQNVSCFLTSMTNDIAEYSANDSMSQDMVFQPMTQSLNMVRGTVDTLKAVLGGLYDDLPNPRLFAQSCPHVIDSYTPKEYLTDLTTFMTKPTSGEALVTELNFFHKKVGNVTTAKNNETEITALLEVSRRASFYTEHLELGVENPETDSCSDVVSSIVIVSGGNNDYFLTVDEYKAEAYEEADQSCFWSVVIAMGEMPTICNLQVRFPNTINPVADESGNPSTANMLNVGSSAFLSRALSAFVLVVYLFLK
jgi:hypothetical protein